MCLYAAAPVCGSGVEEPSRQQKIIVSLTSYPKRFRYLHLTVKSSYTHETFANNFKVKVPVPTNTAVCKVRVGMGRAKYLPESNCILWKVWRFPGQVESTLAADIALIHVTSARPQVWERPPISFDFEVPMFTSSGLLIKYMKVVEKSHYQAVKWVRYLTRAGSYQYRI